MQEQESQIYQKKFESKVPGLHLKYTSNLTSIQDADTIFARFNEVTDNIYFHLSDFCTQHSFSHTRLREFYQNYVSEKGVLDELFIALHRSPEGPHSESIRKKAVELFSAFLATDPPKISEKELDKQFRDGVKKAIAKYMDDLVFPQLMQAFKKHIGSSEGLYRPLLQYIRASSMAHVELTLSSYIDKCVKELHGIAKTEWIANYNRMAQSSSSAATSAFSSSTPMPASAPQAPKRDEKAFPVTQTFQDLTISLDSGLTVTQSSQSHNADDVLGYQVLAHIRSAHANKNKNRAAAIQSLQYAGEVLKKRAESFNQSNLDGLQALGEIRILELLASWAQEKEAVTHLRHAQILCKNRMQPPLSTGSLRYAQLKAILDQITANRHMLQLAIKEANQTAASKAKKSKKITHKRRGKVTAYNPDMYEEDGVSEAKAEPPFPGAAASSGDASSKPTLEENHDENDVSQFDPGEVIAALNEATASRLPANRNVAASSSSVSSTHSVASASTSTAKPRQGPAEVKLSSPPQELPTSAPSRAASASSSAAPKRRPRQRHKKPPSPEVVETTVVAPPPPAAAAPAPSIEAKAPPKDAKTQLAENEATLLELVRSKQPLFDTAFTHPGYDSTAIATLLSIQDSTTTLADDFDPFSARATSNGALYQRNTNVGECVTRLTRILKNPEEALSLEIARMELEAIATYLSDPAHQKLPVRAELRYRPLAVAPTSLPAHVPHGALPFIHFSPPGRGPAQPQFLLPFPTPLPLAYAQPGGAPKT